MGKARRIGRRVVMVTLVGLTVAVLAFVAAMLRVHHFGQRPPYEGTADALVVLGARVLPRGLPSRALKSRAQTAARAFARKQAPLVVATGGAVGDLPSEAQVAKDLMVELGVPASAIVLEEESHSTQDNADLTAKLLEERQIHSVLIVSDDYHLLRARALFSAHGLTVHTLAAERELSDSQQWYWTAREVVALLPRPWAFF